MPDTPNDAGVRNKVVKLSSLEMPPALELPQRPGLETAPSREAPMAIDALTRERYLLALQRLQQATDEVGDAVLVTAQDREVSLLQSALAREAAKKATDTVPLKGGGEEVKFGTGLAGGDWFGWLFSTFKWIDRRDAHPLTRPPTTSADAIADTFRIAMVADWGTGLYGAPVIAKRIATMAPFDLVLHLGDVYYSGTREEVQERLIDVWPHGAAPLHRTLNGNHEMYSGGFGYFQLALPALDQQSSYFAMQNSSWLLAFLDTAYVDHDMDNEQVAWLNLLIKQAPDKKVVLFSHQQLFSRLDQQGPKLYKALRHLLDEGKIAAWYWGHEHQCVIYDPHPSLKLLGRCLGNGGIPEPRKDEVKRAPVQNQVGPIAWKRLSATTDSPSCLALDGPNADIPGEEKKFVPHGFMTLEFNGPVLTERVFLSDGTELLKNDI